MFKLTAVSPKPIKKQTVTTNEVSQTGFLLINQQDEIIYSNQQARRFLGLFTDDTLPVKQTFISLVQAAYQCYPATAWHSWPQRPTAATTRHLIYKAPASAPQLHLKVEILEQITINCQTFWAVALVAENQSGRRTAYLAN